MSDLQIGNQAPDFTLPTDGGRDITLSGLKGQNVVVYFYPKDDTSGCTKQACSFRENLTGFQNLNAAIIGISKCSVAKHDKFKAKYDLNFPLASDENSDVCERYGVWVEKSMYGRKYMGIERATFLIGEDGKIAQIWRRVKVPGHVEAVMQDIENREKSRSLTARSPQTVSGHLMQRRLNTAPGIARTVHVVMHMGDQVIRLVVEEMVRPFHDAVINLDPLLHLDLVGHRLHRRLRHKIIAPSMNNQTR